MEQQGYPKLRTGLRNTCSAHRVMLCFDGGLVANWDLLLEASSVSSSVQLQRYVTRSFAIHQIFPIAGIRLIHNIITMSNTLSLKVSL